MTIVHGSNSNYRRSEDLARQRRKLCARIVTLSEAELALTTELIEQLVLRFDPDIVADFLSWRDDPRIESILQIAASLDPEALEQLLFEAEHLTGAQPLKSNQS